MSLYGPITPLAGEDLVDYYEDEISRREDRIDRMTNEASVDGDKISRLEFELSCRPEEGDLHKQIHDLSNDKFKLECQVWVLTGELAAQRSENGDKVEILEKLAKSRKDVKSLYAALRFCQGALEELVPEEEKWKKLYEESCYAMDWLTVNDAGDLVGKVTYDA